MLTENKKYDVVVLGGGLAGLTFALQLKNERESVSILVLEQRSDLAPESAHKVGESTVEIGTYYLREVLGLGDYLEEHQLPKYGLRFFFSPELSTEITERVEFGATYNPPIPSHQIDRGIFENYLIEKLQGMGVDIEMGVTVNACDINYEGHFVKCDQGDQAFSVETKWIVDGSGRRAILKHQLGLKKEMDHDTNAVWFRVEGEIDIQDWASEEKWKVQLKPGFRRLSTVHLMGEGYWVWLIPLVSGNTSVGIVTDAKLHTFEKLNRFDRAMEWLREHEPMCFDEVNKRKDNVLDFMSLKHYAHHAEEIYSTDRWAITGDAGAFLDPFYSPGTDFIGMNNSWITDLVNRDLNEEDIHVRTMAFNRTHLSVVDSWIPIYRNKYPLFGKAQIMCPKICWDWTTYWAIPSLLFTNKGYTNMDVMRKLVFTGEGPVQRFGALNESMQRVFEEWNDFEHEEVSGMYMDPFNIPCLRNLHEEMVILYDTDELIEKVTENLRFLEELAVQIFRKISSEVHGTNIDLKVNPYQMSLKIDDNSGVENAIEHVSPEIVGDVDQMWLSD